MKSKLFGSIIAVATQLFLVCTVSAITIYSESTNGDLDAIGSTNVALVTGENTISGILNATPPAESDRIRFTQTAGLVIDSITLSFATPFGNGEIANTSLFNNQANLFDDNFSSLSFGTANIVASFLDSLGPETGPLSKTTDGAVWDFTLSAGTIFANKGWTLTINTTAAPNNNVPEFGSTLWLLGGGLLMLIGARYKIA